MGDDRGHRLGQPHWGRDFRGLHGDGAQDRRQSNVALSLSLWPARRYLPSALMFLTTLGWIGVNTYFPVKIAVAILGQFGIADSVMTNMVVISVVVLLQMLIGVYGFYAIRTFEKYTVPVTVAIMVLIDR